MCSPEVLLKSMANNEILQIVVFAIFFGIATAAIGEKGKIFIRALDSLTEIILKVTGYIMHFAPVAAFAAVSAILSLKGPEILITYGKFIGVFYLSVLLLWVLLIGYQLFMDWQKSFRDLGKCEGPGITCFYDSQFGSRFSTTDRRAGKIRLPKKNCQFCFAAGLFI